MTLKSKLICYPDLNEQDVQGSCAVGIEHTYVLTSTDSRIEWTWWNIGKGGAEKAVRNVCWGQYQHFVTQRWNV